MNITKKILVAAILSFAFVLPAQAQLGNLLNKAVNKTVNRTVDKVADSIADAASNALFNTLGLRGQKNAKNASDTAAKAQVGEEVTYEQLMSKAANLPTAAQVADFANYQINEMTLKLTLSPVTRYLTSIYSLSAQATALAYQDADTAAYQEYMKENVKAATGLTDADLKAMESMSDEEQEAFLTAKMQNRDATAAVVQRAEALSKYSGATEKLMDKYQDANDRVDKILDADAKAAKEIYDAKYAKKLEGLESSSSKYKTLMAQYCAEVAPAHVEAVRKAMGVRLSEQLPIAQQIDEINDGIAKNHPEENLLFPKYCQLTALAYFAEAASVSDLGQ